MGDILPLRSDPEERLRTALRLLAAAQEDQWRAVSDFRENLCLLRDTTARLEDGVFVWDKTVATLREEADRAAEASRLLSGTAERL